jgi:hypothetical protein
LFVRCRRLISRRPAYLAMKAELLRHKNVPQRVYELFDEMERVDWTLPRAVRTAKAQAIAAELMQIVRTKMAN